MKKVFLTKSKNYYKANLHCHSTVSDGKLTPAELKEHYKSHGYSIVAYTDHNALISHNDLTDDSFLAMNGVELDITPPIAPGCGSLVQTCHICFVSLSPENLIQPCYHRGDLYHTGNTPEYKKFIKYDDSKPDFVREYTPECISRAMKEGRDTGFFVTYNHPSWSLETINEYGNYHGMHAMEICNYGCVESGYTDYNEKEYDEMLCGGEKIFCIATDDNHNWRNDSFGGFTVINADKLEYSTIADALLNGSFYASQGPEIYELWYEDGKIGIECSEACSIAINTDIRRAGRRHYITDNDGKPLTTAVFNIPEQCKFIRLTVTDLSGNHANTNAIFMEDLK